MTIAVVAHGDKWNDEFASEMTELEMPHVTLAENRNFAGLFKRHIAENKTSFLWERKKVWVDLL